MTELTQMS